MLPTVSFETDRLEIKDCGRFDLDEESLAMYFTCNVCLADLPQSSQPTP